MPGCNQEARAVEIDGLVRKHFPARAGFALLAVGGYGRRELFPYSDIDLLILADSEERIHSTREAAATFLQFLWDARLRVSQSTRTPSDCLTLHQNNPELTVSLLDQRFVAGDRETYQALVLPLQNFLVRRKDEIARRLVRLTRERHGKFQDTIFHLEPNVKDGPGGLRDCQLLRWLDRLSASGHAAQGIASSFDVLTGLRCDLHLFSGRDNNVLSFEAQDRIAESRGITPANLMASFYEAARRVQRTVSRTLEARESEGSPLFSNMRERWSRVSNTDFSVLHGLVYFRSPQQVQSDPASILRFFALIARHGCRSSPDANRRIAAHNAELASKFQAHPGIWHDLSEIAALPHAALALREMHECELLTAIFPELAAIEDLVVRDFYHLYTVDEHTLVAIEKVFALRSAGLEGAFSELARETTETGVLVLSLLFHDAGKGTGAQSHSAESARIAHPALRRIGVPLREIETILFLIDAHLEMSAIMNSRDLSDPTTARILAARTGTVERLKLLTLLTWADISAVNPTAMTAWRASLLWQLYLATHRELTHELQTDRIPADGGDTPDRRNFLEGLPVRYLRTHSPAEIETHMRMEREGTAVVLERQQGVYVLTLVTRDRPFLFASAAGALSSFGMDIVKAEAFGNARGAVIDIFTFADPIRTLELNPSETERLQSVVIEAALGRTDVNRLLSRRPQRSPQTFPPRVTIERDAAEGATLIEIIAEDRPRLLYDLAFAISRENCSIQVVLINTEAHKAIDVFYVTCGGSKLSTEMSEKLAEALSFAAAGTTDLRRTV